MSREAHMAVIGTRVKKFNLGATRGTAKAEGLIPRSCKERRRASAREMEQRAAVGKQNPLWCVKANAVGAALPAG